MLTQVKMIAMLVCLSGCANGLSGSALAEVLRKPLAVHTEALVGNDINQMRRTGLAVVAIYDAAIGEE